MLIKIKRNWIYFIGCIRRFKIWLRRIRWRQNKIRRRNWIIRLVNQALLSWYFSWCWWKWSRWFWSFRWWSIRWRSIRWWSIRWWNIRKCKWSFRKWISNFQKICKAGDDRDGVIDYTPLKEISNAWASSEEEGEGNHSSTPVEPAVGTNENA